MASRILIAGAHPGAGSDWALKLALSGDITFAVSNLFEASCAAGWWQPDVVLVELGQNWLDQLPGARSFRRDHPLVPIVGLSLVEDRGIETEAEAAGIDLLLEPPILVRELRLSLEWVIQEVALVVHGSPRASRRSARPPAAGAW